MVFMGLDRFVYYSSSLWVQVEIDVKINEWFGVFYDMIQKALAEPNAVSIEEYFASLFSFITLAGMYIAVYVAISYFTAHFLFIGGRQWLNGITLFMTKLENRRCT